MSHKDFFKRTWYNGRNIYFLRTQARSPTTSERKALAQPATYDRLESPTQTPEIAKCQEESQEIWGRATMPVAVIRWEPEELIEQKFLKFHQGFDDLDYVVFSMLSLPSNRCVTLVRHKNSPSLGTEICIVPNEAFVVETLVETIRVLNLSIEDLSWIHAQYESKVNLILLGVN